MWFEIKFKLNALKLEGFNLSDSKFRKSILIDSKFGDNFDDSSWEDLSCVTLYYIQLYTQVYAQMWLIITMSHNILILFSSLPSLSPSYFDIMWCNIVKLLGLNIIVEYIHRSKLNDGVNREIGDKKWMYCACTSKHNEDSH